MNKKIRSVLNIVAGLSAVGVICLSCSSSMKEKSLTANVIDSINADTANISASKAGATNISKSSPTHEKKVSPSKVSPIDISLGIQDVVLGQKIEKYKDRITYTDNFVGGTPDTGLYFVMLNNEIGEECRGTSDRLQVSTFKGRIMEISKKKLWCPGLKQMFVNKFGKPTQSFGDNSSWVGKKATLIFRFTGESFGAGKPAYEIIMTHHQLTSEFEKSIKGNL